ncbi:glycosyltransferase [Fuchsiella alkaliacetigena]|uniref:glycosyltransferase n=1 Tax=Fuchsiella alkaliacetigena TaxID=957042 RepID=UPI002009EC14|nr:glycosyltransferase [Fuchsiella alkaliacetigena]MCK8824990.1 glycosyltransferase [Fuchsiella alkaliacetigena]
MLKIGVFLKDSFFRGDPFLIEDLFKDLEKRLNLEIITFEERLKLIGFSEADLIITDDQVAVISLLEAEQEVVYYFKGEAGLRNLVGQNIDKLSVVVNSNYLKEKLPAELKEQTEVIKPGVRNIFYRSLPAEEIIDTGKRRILVAGAELTDSVLTKIISSLELIENTCQLEVVILRERDFELETKVDYKVLNPLSLDWELIEYSSADLAIVYDSGVKFNLVPLKIMACKTPTVVLVEKEKAEYLEADKNCRLLKEFGRNDIAIITLELLKDNILAKNIAAAAKLTAQNYTWSQMLQAWQELIAAQTDKLERELIEKQAQIKQKTSALIDIVIINQGDKEEIADLLNNLEESIDYEYQLIVVNNGGSRESLDYLKSITEVTLIDNQQSINRAQAYNQGIRAGKGEYILLFSRGIRVNKSCLANLINTIQNESKTVLVRPSFVNEGKEGVAPKIEEFGRKDLAEGWSSLVDKEDYWEMEEWASINESIYLFRRDLLSRVGLLTAGYTFYFEKVDYLLRVKTKDYQVIDSSESKVYKKDWDEKQLTPALDKDSFSEDKSLFTERWAQLLSSPAESTVPEAIVVLGTKSWPADSLWPAKVLSKLSETYQVIYIAKSEVAEQENICYEESLKLAKLKENLYLASPFKQLTGSLAKEEADKLKAQLINDTLDRVNISKPLFWVDRATWLSVIEYLAPKMVIYNYLDKQAKELTAVQEKLLILADLVLVSTKDLVTTVEEYNSQVNQAQISSICQAALADELNEVENLAAIKAEIERLIKQTTKAEVEIAEDKQVISKIKDFLIDNLGNKIN